MSASPPAWRELADAIGRSKAGLDWQRVLPASGRLDPYMAWYEAQGWPGLASTAPVTVLVQTTSNARLHLKGIPIMLTHGTWFPLGSFVRSHRLALKDLHGLQAAVEAGTVLRFEVEVARTSVAEGAGRLSVADERVAVASAALPAEQTLAEERRLDEQERLARRERRRREPLIGVVDDALNFQHGRWRVGEDTPDDVCFSKLKLLWDQSDSIDADGSEAAAAPAGRTEVAPPRAQPSGPGPGGPSGASAAPWVDYTRPPVGEPGRLPGPPPRPGAPPPVALPEPTFGRELREGALDVAAGSDNVDRAYERYEYPRARARTRSRRGGGPGMEMRTLPMRDWSHGVAVASVIDHESGGLPAHSLMFASLPLRSTEDTSGGSLAGLALDAIVHFLCRADGRPLVVNLSYGTHQGPHDGSSLFETALDELLRDHENLHVVLPMGNSHLSRTHQQALLRPGESLDIPWKILPDDSTDSFLEVWCHEAQATWAVDLVPPGGLPPQRASAGQAFVLESSYGERRDLHAAVVFPKHAAQGLNGNMALVAISPTLELDGSRRPASPAAPRLPRRVAPDGVWTVRVTNTGQRILGFHAWIQRDDAAPGGTRAARGQQGRQSYVMDTGRLQADPSSTINGIATLDPARYGGRLIIAGALREQDGGLSTYSAAGPALDVQRGGTLGPSMVVAGDESMNRPGLLVPGSFGRAKRRIAGTSLSAAVIAGRLFRHLQTGGRAADFCPRSVCGPSERPIVPEGSPGHAPLVFRGVHERFFFEPHPERLDQPIKGLAGGRA